LFTDKKQSLKLRGHIEKIGLQKQIVRILHVALRSIVSSRLLYRMKNADANCPPAACSCSCPVTATARVHSRTAAGVGDERAISLMRRQRGE
jgi:hypothetical protein